MHLMDSTSALLHIVRNLKTPHFSHTHFTLRVVFIFCSYKLVRVRGGGAVVAKIETSTRGEEILSFQ